jgi:hypothetical protein
VGGIEEDLPRFTDLLLSRSQIGSATAAKKPSRSLVTTTPRDPWRSSRTSARTYRSEATFSNGLVRLAYQIRHEPSSSRSRLWLVV